MLIESRYIPYEAQLRIRRGRALFFAPHPDDEVFGCSGALLQHVADGDEVRVVVVTDGSFGHSADLEDYRQARERESRAAALILGYDELVFWRYPDRGLVSNSALVGKIQTEILAFKADIVYAPSWWEIHPDHAALSEAVTGAVRALGGRVVLALYEVGVPLQANCLLDITPLVEIKKKAMAAFSGQLALQSYDRHILALNVFRTYTLPSRVRYAEAYRIVEPHELLELAKYPLMRMNERDG